MRKQLTFCGCQQCETLRRMEDEGKLPYMTRINL